MDCIHIGYSFLSNAQWWAAVVRSRSVCIISDTSIANYYLASLHEACEKAGARQVQDFLISPGEEHKSLLTAERIWDFLIKHEFDRECVLIALGGGVVGDLTGFCAACYLRGVKYIQCPTSLLAQVDSAIGGKTAINHPLGKNLIGAFYMPHQIVMDLNTIRSLPDRELSSALAEIIKYALIMDPEFFVWLENNIENLLLKEASAIEFAVRRSVALKERIVLQDEKDNGIRAILNFGHTVGHAIESSLNYQQWTHGEAVAVGMVVAVYLSCLRYGVEKQLLDRLIALLNRAKLPNTLPKGITKSLIFVKMKKDKKHSQGKLSWVLLKALGNACPGNVVVPEEIQEALMFCSSIRVRTP